MKTAIIRSLYERTEPVCAKLLKEQGFDVHYVRNLHPFSFALHRSYEEAVRIGNEYTLIIDADVIPTNLDVMYELIERTNAFMVNPLVWDNLTATITPGGPKLYRTKDLEVALEYFSYDENLEDVTKRPETYVIKKMSKRGYQPIYLDIPLGYHDFEQWEKDLERKYDRKKNKGSFAKLLRKVEGFTEPLTDFSIDQLDVKDFTYNGYTNQLLKEKPTIYQRVKAKL